MAGERFNASEYPPDRRLDAGGAGRLALMGPAGALTYEQLYDLACRTTTGLREIGSLPEQHVVVFMADGPEFVVTYLAAMRVGAVRVPVPTMLRPDDLAEFLFDSHASREPSATLFFTGPSFFAAMLRSALPPDAFSHVRLADSAGESLPAPRRVGGDRDAAHLPLEPGWRRAPRDDRRRPSRLRAPDRRRRPRRAGQHPGHPGRDRTVRRDWLLVPLRRQPRGLQGERLRTGGAYVRDDKPARAEAVADAETVLRGWSHLGRLDGRYGAWTSGPRLG